MIDPATPTPVPSPWDLRADLVARVTADLLGPLDGEHEVIRGYQFELRRPAHVDPDPQRGEHVTSEDEPKKQRWSSPGRVRDRYLVGMLAPKGTVAADPERDDDVGPERVT